jgi:hypothetical protein
MLLYIILFILLQPDYISKKRGLIDIPEIVLRSFVFIAIIYVVKQYEEGFQNMQPPKGIQLIGDAESLQLVGTRLKKLDTNFTNYLSNIENYIKMNGVPNFFGNMPEYKV